MHDQSASRMSGRTRAAVSAMCVRALRITVLKSAGNFTRDECHDLNAEKIQRVKCFMFEVRNLLRASNFRTPARPAGFENFRLWSIGGSGGLLRHVRSTPGSRHQSEGSACPLGATTSHGTPRRGTTRSRLRRTRPPIPVPPVGQITPAVGPEPAAKIFPFCSHPNQFIPAAVPPGKRGGSRSSRNARWDAVAAMDTTDERDTLRTAKSCGPGAATLASSFTSHIVERRWQESPFTGESAK